jgi:hypothetical protein
VMASKRWVIAGAGVLVNGGGFPKGSRRHSFLG